MLEFFLYLLEVRKGVNLLVMCKIFCKICLGYGKDVRIYLRVMYSINGIDNLEIKIFFKIEVKGKVLEDGI